MFTGLISGLGKITHVARGTIDIGIVVEAPTHFIKGVVLGDSISVSGVCLTVAELSSDSMTFYVSSESLLCTTFSDISVDDVVNLEKCLTLSSPIGGHILTGHVHSTATIRSIIQEGGSWVFDIEIPKELMCYMAQKGAVALDGVSLTVNRVAHSSISINCIPHTLAHTTLGTKKEGDRLNVEIDLIMIYIDRLINGDNTQDIKLIGGDFIQRFLGMKMTEH